MMVLVFAVPLYDLLQILLCQSCDIGESSGMNRISSYASSTARPQASVSDNNMKDTSCLT